MCKAISPEGCNTEGCNNLVSDKSTVFKEVYTVLKPGGRMMISDLALTKEFPSIVNEVIALFSGNTSKIIPKNIYMALVSNAGFNNVKIMGETAFPIDAWHINPNIKQLFKKFAPQSIKGLANRVVSLRLYATKQEN